MRRRLDLLLTDLYALAHGWRAVALVLTKHVLSKLKTESEG